MRASAVPRSGWISTKPAGEPVSAAAGDRPRQLAVIAARTTYTGRTSMEIRVNVDREDLGTGRRDRTSTAYLTFVAIDDQGRPVPVPPILPETDDEQRRFREALERREIRLKRREG